MQRSKNYISVGRPCQKMQCQRLEGDPSHATHYWTHYLKSQNVWCLSSICSKEASSSGPCSPLQSRTKISTTLTWRGNVSRTRQCLRIQSFQPSMHRCILANHCLVLCSGNDQGWVAMVLVVHNPDISLKCWIKDPQNRDLMYRIPCRRRCFFNNGWNV